MNNVFWDSAGREVLVDGTDTDRQGQVLITSAYYRDTGTDVPEEEITFILNTYDSLLWELEAERLANLIDNSDFEECI